MTTDHPKSCPHCGAEIRDTYSEFFTFTCGSVCFEKPVGPYLSRSYDCLTNQNRKLRDETKELKETIRLLTVDCDYVGGVQWWKQRHAELAISSLDAINELKTEHEKLKSELKMVQKWNEELLEENAKLTARLKAFDPSDWDRMIPIIHHTDP